MEKINFMQYYVYIHTFPNKKVYIGITYQNPNRRWRNNGKGYQKQNYVYNAIKKYGWENIKHEILYTNLTKQEAEQKEIELIAKYKSNNANYGYNIANGGNCNGTMNESTKALIKEKLKGNKNAKGSVRSKEQIEFIKNMNKGNKNMLGKHHSKETKEKMRMAKLGKKMPLETKIKKGRPVIMLDKDLKYINEFYSITEAHNKTNINLTNIHECCNKKRQTAGGYIWRYKEGEMTYQ